MLKKLLLSTFAMAALLVFSSDSFAQPTPAVGDFGSVTSGNWSAVSTWKQWDGAGWNTTPTGGPGSSKVVFILTGTTVTYDVGSQNCKGLVVQPGATFKSDSTLPCPTSSLMPLKINGPNVWVDGAFGSGPNDALVLETKYNGVITLAGSGIVNIAQVRPNSGQSGTMEFVFAMNANINYAGLDSTGGPGIYTQRGTQTSSTITINAGDTVNFAKNSNFMINSTAGLNGLMNTTLNVNGVVNDTGTVVLADSSTASATLNIGSTGKLIIRGSSLVDSLNGANIATINVDGTYEHAMDGGIIPTANWHTGSTCLLTGSTTMGPTNANQDFYNLTVNCPNLTVPSYPCHFDMGNNTIAGDVTFKNTNGNYFALTGYEVAGLKTITVDGSFSVDSSSAYVAIDNYSSSHGKGNTTLEVKGKFASKGTFSLSVGSSKSNNNLVLLGDLTLQPGTNFAAHSSTADTVFFAGTGVQKYSASSLSNNNWIQTCVRNGSTVDMDTSTFAGSSSSFTLKDGATLKTSHSLGLDGNITVGGAKNISKGTSFVFYGKLPQVTGTIIPDSVDNLTIDSTAIVTTDTALTVNGTLLVNGKLINKYGVTSTDTAIVNGTYEHALDGGVIPKATWNIGSTCLVTGLSDSNATGANQAFYNFIVDCDSLTQPSIPIHFDMQNNTIAGDVIIHNTNQRYLALTGFDTPGPKNITINGNLSVDSASDYLAVDDYSSTHPVESVNLTVKGDLSVVGSFGLTVGSAKNLVNLFLHGNMSLKEGSSFFSHSGTFDSVFFAGNAVQTYVAGVLSNGNHINTRVTRGTTFDMDTSAFQGSGSSFTLDSGATVRSGHPAGLNGNLTIGGGTTLSSGASYVYDGIVAQETGTVLPDTLYNLTIDDSLGVVLTQPTLINGTLTLKAGLFNNAIAFTLGPNGTVVYAGGKLLIPLNLNVVTIAEARKDDNHDLIPDHSVTGDTLKVFGIVTSPNMGATYTSYYIQDATAGINVYKGGTAMSFAIGDSVFVIGKIMQNHGLTEISPLVADSVHFGILKHNATVPAPRHLTLHQYASAPESFEGLLIEVDSLFKVSGTWGSGASINLTNVSHADTAVLYINANTTVAGSAEPQYPINLVGIASQYTSSASVYNDGYEIIPRDTADIVHIIVLGVNNLLNDIPKDFYISQNYPNPFNPSTTINFGLPKEAQVQITVYNILGQKAAVLVDENMKAGNHQVVFTGARFASGMYIYVMRAGDKVFKEKMLLLK